MRCSRLLPTSSALALLLCGLGFAQTTQLVSRGIGGGQANGNSGYYVLSGFTEYVGYAITPDGRYLAYASEASDLVPGDSNGLWDIFRLDRQTGSTIRVSVGLGGAQSNGWSEYPSISADGRYVNFTSGATNLVAGDTHGAAHAYVYDCQTAVTTLVSVNTSGAPGNNDTLGGAISGDGRYVAFTSLASDLVPGDTNGCEDTFVRDLHAGTTTRVSVSSQGVQANGPSARWPTISSDGRYVAFSSSADNLVPGDTNAQWDVFVHDNQTGSTVLASVDSSGIEGDDWSGDPSMSADGRYVAFDSLATNLLPLGSSGLEQVFVHDLQTGATTLVSVTSSGYQANDHSAFPSFSADDRYVVFVSLATNLVPNDSNGALDVFVHDTQAGTTSCVSVRPDGNPGDGESLNYWIQSTIVANGRYVVFGSSSTNLVAGDTNGYYDIFLRDLQTQTTTRLSLQGSGLVGNSASMMPSFADGAGYVAFTTYSSDLIPGLNGTGQIMVRNVSTGAMTLASVSSSGAQGDQRSFQACLSSDGRYVAFNSDADNLVPGDNNGVADVFVRDQQAGITTRVNVAWNGWQSTVQSAAVSMSSDGRYVSFDSPDPIVQGDTNSNFDVFVSDMQAGTTVLASLGAGGVQGNGPSTISSLSADGRYVAFCSGATNLVSGDTNGFWDVFVRDLQAGTTTRVNLGAGGAQANADTTSNYISADGRYVAFSTAASNLVSGDTNGVSDVFVRDLQTGTTTRESVGANGAQGNDASYAAAISRGGRFVVFVSAATNLVTGDTNGVPDVFVRDRLTGQTSRVSVNTAGVQGDQASAVYNYYLPPTISPDGRLVAFDSLATDFASDDTNGVSDVFLRDRGNDAVFAPFCFGDGSAAACPCGNSGAPGHGCGNSSSSSGALLTGAGTPSLSVDTVHVTSSGELPTSTSVLLSGPGIVNSVHYGDGLRCAGGTLKRLYIHSAVGGTVTMPQGSDLSVSARSAAAGDPLSPGSTRIYQVYYRDPSATFCAAPTGGTFNISNALAVVWGP